MKTLQNTIRRGEDGRAIMTEMEIVAIRLLSKIEEKVNSPIATSEYKVEEIKKLITDFGL